MARFIRNILTATAFAATAAVASPAYATNWDMPTPYGDTVFHTQNIMQFADDVKQATGGDLQITVHSANSLFGHAEIKDAVRKGLAPIGEILLSRLANENPIFGIDSIPFLAASYDDATKLWDASRDQITAKLDEQGLKVLFSVPWPGQSLYAQEEIKSTDQMQGVTFRAYNAATERLAQLMGAVPTQVEAGDIPTAFSTGRVEAMMTSPSTGVSSKAWDFVSNYIDTQAWLPKNIVFVNKDAFNALPEDQQKAVMDAAKKAETRGWEMSKAETKDKIAELEKNGMKVSQPTDELKGQLGEIGKTMTDEWLKEAGDDGKAVVDSYRSM